ncbi:MAG: DUF1385 domain-containing protein [Eggerthellaceae bacterium]|nr:DUF1385 domain-containing protein [Eggerthellaceae bacterium]
MTETKQKSDLSRAFSEDGELKTHVGGQALLEGIMMRGKYNWSVAVREPQGTIYLEEHDLASGKDKNGWLYWPFIRGCRAFVESLTLGYKALSIAAEHAYLEDDDENAAESSPEPSGDVGAQGDSDDTYSADAEESPSRDFSWKRDFGHPDEMVDALGAQRTLEIVTEPAVETSLEEEKQDAGASEKKPLLSDKEMLISMVLGLVMGVVLFIVAPAFITNLIVGEYDDRTLLWNIVDGVLRVAIFIFYIWLIGRMSDIKRMFGYHGAEHKTIHCFEHGLPLTPENARSFPRLHVRCGTAFLITVMIIAILVYTITPIDALIEAWGVPSGAPKLVLVIVVRILLMPVIAGIAYEVTVKWAGSHPNNLLVKVILWPGMQMQYLTTREPDDGQIECAIEAMKLVLAREEREATASAE